MAIAQGWQPPPGAAAIEVPTQLRKAKACAVEKSGARVGRVLQHRKMGKFVFWSVVA